MISWSTKRKLKYILSVAFFFLFVGVAIAFVALYKPASCSDGKRDGNEQGIDCGGSCTKVCEASATEVRIDWVRPFKVKDGVWSVATYLENPNVNYQAKSVYYKFRVYDSNDVLIAEPSGIAFIPASQSFGIFEGGLSVGDRVPKRATFEWQSAPVWEKVANQNDLIIVKDVTRTINDQGLPKVSAILENQGLKTIRNVAGFVVVYNNSGNAIAASKTVVDQVVPGNNENMVFSWPAAFTDQIGRVEILHWVIFN